MKVRELFEEPDKSFITMMNQILADIPELKQKKSEFDKKIADVAASIPGLIQKQKDLEAWMTSAVEAVKLIPNTMLKPFMPELKGLENQYKENASVLDMLSFHLPFSFEHERTKAGKKPSTSLDDDEWTDVVKDFVKKHGDDLEDCIRAVDHGFDAIKDMARKEKWPMPWERVGPLSSEKHIFTRMQEELLYWINELRNGDV